MAIAAKSIFKPFKTDLDTFQDYFKNSMTSNLRIVDEVAKYLVRHKGKQLRPMLVVLSARTVSEPTPGSYRAAVVVELLHTATLIHDDVVDEAELRRGFPTINKIWKNKISILMGDYLLAKSLIIATEIGNLELMNIIANVAKSMSKGELLQIHKARKLNINEEEYFQLIQDKTASLISACCEIGAMTANATPEQRYSMKKYGQYLGIAFQIKDDLLDYQSNSGILGKPTGHDLKDKKITLPLLYAFQESDTGERKRIIRMMKNGVRRRQIDHIIDFIIGRDGIRKAEEKADHYKNLAVSELRKLPESESRQALMDLAEFVVNRTK
ncbi:MAG: polyprenyl synthetase family protein [Calditrichaeota bacterium]|nr:polyprenyl synthetase family protein [Calditrichota bacterium]RQV99276.1 MAG: polyprenyl synthetase family protein [Calditrichota bacterium]